MTTSHDDEMMELQTAASRVRRWARTQLSPGGYVSMPGLGWVFVSSCPTVELAGRVFFTPASQFLIDVSETAPIVVSKVQGEVVADPYTADGARLTQTGRIAPYPPGLMPDALHAHLVGFLERVGNLFSGTGTAAPGRRLGTDLGALGTSRATRTPQYPRKPGMLTRRA